MSNPGRVNACTRDTTRNSGPATMLQASSRLVDLDPVLASELAPAASIFRLVMLLATVLSHPSLVGRRLRERPVVDQADPVALGIAELRELDQSAGHGHRAHHHLGAVCHGDVERLLDIVRLDVDRHASGPAAGHDAAPDAGLSGLGVYQPGLHRAAGVDRPSEDLPVEVEQQLAILAVDLEVRNRVAHRLPPSLVSPR